LRWNLHGLFQFLNLLEQPICCFTPFRWVHFPEDITIRLEKIWNFLLSNILLKIPKSLKNGKYVSTTQNEKNVLKWCALQKRHWTTEKEYKAHKSALKVKEWNNSWQRQCLKWFTIQKVSRELCIETLQQVIELTSKQETIKKASKWH
jgi:hypothetical protein